MGLNPYDPNVTIAMMEEELAMKQAEDALVSELRERWDRAFFAALGGGLMACGEGELWPSIDSPILYCGKIANETIRRHAELMASRDAVIAEVVG